jgi:hypothetical protein
MWAKTPVLDRWAFAWMWNHGGFLVFPPEHPFSVSGRMPPELMNDVVEGRATTVEGWEMSIGGDPVSAQVLALDVVQDHAVVWLVSIASDGGWSSDLIHLRLDGGDWVPMAATGSGGDDWTSDCHPPIDGWDGDVIIVGCTYGSHQSGDPFGVWACTGYVTPRVHSIEVARNGRARSVPITSGAGAFVVLTIGTGPTTLQPCGLDGSQVGTACVCNDDGRPARRPLRRWRR